MKNIVLVIDWQKIYLRCGENPSRYKGQAVENTRRIIEQARKRNDQIVWIAFTKSSDIFNPKRSDGIVPELGGLAADYDPVFIKGKSDAFTNNDFAKWLDKQDFDRLIFTGFSIFDCVKATLSGAIERGYGNRCVVARDACAPAPAKNTSLSFMFSQLADFFHGQTVSTGRLLRAMQDDRIVEKTIPYNQERSQNPVPACAKIWQSAGQTHFDMYLKMNPANPKLSPDLMNKWAQNAGIEQSLMAELCNTKEDVVFSPAHFKIMQKLAANLVRSIPG